ncbi:MULTISPECIES: universal stress protein [unclassified Nocardia]|uniref:universal stress protein n=1 Tax=unclassified Nocardia TaxID=2637762 RepID=UPI00278BF948|nr:MULTISPECIES: universal stress protein [unclassified Nocardia]
MDPKTPQRRPGPPHGADRQPPVVVGVDGSAAALRAVEWAAAAALSRSAPLRLVYVLPPLDRPQYRPGGSRHRQAAAALDSARRTALRSTAELESTAPLDIVVDIRHGHADRELLELSRSADLIAARRRRYRPLRTYGAGFDRTAPHVGRDAAPHAVTDPAAAAARCPKVSCPKVIRCGRATRERSAPHTPQRTAPQRP